MLWDFEITDPKECAKKLIEDPALEIKLKNKWLVMQRIKGKIRYYAENFESWDRRFENNYLELGTLENLIDSIKFAKQFLDDTPFKEISVSREIFCKKQQTFTFNQ